MPKHPEGKFMSTVRVGERGQIVIPKGARTLFNIQPGDTLLLLADINQGIAIVPYDPYEVFAKGILQAKSEEEEANEGD